MTSTTGMRHPFPQQAICRSTQRRSAAGRLAGDESESTCFDACRHAGTRSQEAEPLSRHLNHESDRGKV